MAYVVSEQKCFSCHSYTYYTQNIDQSTSQVLLVFAVLL